MAGDSAGAGLPLTPSRLAALVGLTKAISEAVVQGDLNRALLLLERRYRALRKIDWSAEGVRRFEAELSSLREMEGEILRFCRSWRQALAKRLEAAQAGRRLRHTYDREETAGQYVDVHR
ncbi:MAG: hypothetical protein JRI59_03005 [Deltaproteobacteria bacterium]|nr:hypothetical protein [Deltaproteobacteria bacterium]